ncbi:3-phenylpropionate MFS transporter [Vibrio viridaestus]|uniref:3-phenylpropionate MFS transporter n=1 Tax=Vibrio viridaestus TaxID=2487322 RepID=A0A3N9TCC9_9VIBR|nr:3-phenylpropionate MFS transporter [Vibrio viridaestus]RQW61680.1 3-phenylpropionate MFS transporter [Vibrio viridaestus]
MLQISPFRWASQFYVGFFFVYGVYLPFWALWLEYKGMDSAQVGILVGLAFATRCGANLLLTPKVNQAEQLLPALRWISLFMIACLALFAVDDSFYWLCFLTILFNLGIGPTLPLSDAFANHYAKRKLLDYGRSRLWGSAAFIAGSTLVGWLALHLGNQVILYTAFVGACVMLLFSLLKPNPEPKGDGPSTMEKKESLVALLKNKSVILFLLMVAFIQGSHAAYYGFSSIYWKSVGYSEETIGYLWSLGVIAEILAFAVSKSVFAKLSIRTLFVIASIAVMFRWGVTALTTELYALVFVQLFHSMTFAVAHIAAIRYIQCAPGRLMVPLQALYNALPLGLVVAVLTPISGWGFSHWGGLVFFGMSVMGLLALFVPVRLLGSDVQEESKQQKTSAEAHN